MNTVNIVPPIPSATPYATPRHATLRHALQLAIEENGRSFEYRETTPYARNVSRAELAQSSNSRRGAVLLRARNQQTLGKNAAAKKKKQKKTRRMLFDSQEIWKY